MSNELVNIRTFRPFDTLPSLRIVATEQVESPSYHFEGKYRQSEVGCFFFQYTLSGYGIFKDSKGEHKVTSGHGFLCRNDDPNVAYWYPQDSSEAWEFIWFGCSGMETLKLVNELTDNFGSVYAIDKDSTLLQPFFSYQNMEGLHLDLDAASSARIVYDFLLGLLELSTPAASEDGHAIIAQKAMYYIRNNISEDINANDLANYLDLSREHFSRVFKEQTGSTPYQYILRQKMLRACRYLKETDMSQKEIARNIGYSSVENFSRSFTRFIKLSPGRYRKHGAPVLE